jgi:hypothetical protein
VELVSSDALGKKYADDVRLELLRSTYRMPREQHAALYGIVDEIRNAFGIEATATLYQAQEDGPMNAGLVFVPGELHVVFRGPVQAKLTELELRALLGHELAHHKLWTESEGAYCVANALIEDGLLACDDLGSAVACLVKVGTGLDRVDGLAYLQQAQEALAAKDTKSEGRTHPETFIRAFALESWAKGGDFAVVERRVEGPVELDALDLVQQRALTRTTRRLVEAILAPAALRTEATLAHARRFFPDFPPSPPSASASSHAVADEPPLDFADASESVGEYVAYVLLDFAMADHEIDDVALAHAASLATTLGIKAAFRKIAKKELKLSVAALAELEGRGIRLDTEPPPAVAVAIAVAVAVATEVTS